MDISVPPMGLLCDNYLGVEVLCAQMSKGESTLHLLSSS